MNDSFCFTLYPLQSFNKYCLYLELPCLPSVPRQSFTNYPLYALQRFIIIPFVLHSLNDSFCFRLQSFTNYPLFTLCRVSISTLCICRVWMLTFYILYPLQNFNNSFCTRCRNVTLCIGIPSACYQEAICHMLRKLKFCSICFLARQISISFSDFLNPCLDTEEDFYF